MNSRIFRSANVVGDVVINGRTYQGNVSITQQGDKTVIISSDGETILEPCPVINVVVNGDVGEIDVGQGTVTVNGSCNGNIRVGQGDIDVKHHVDGDVKTGMGDISCGRVGGNVKTGMGDIHID